MILLDARPDPTPGVTCDTCGQRHQAEYSHVAQYGGQRVYAVVCTQDNLTDYYTEDVVTGL